MARAKRTVAPARAYDPMTQLTSEQPDTTLLRFLTEGPGGQAKLKPHQLIALIEALARDGGAHEAFDAMVARRRDRAGGR
jgi:hypothetical protein